jgi:hypothetical protein
MFCALSSHRVALRSSTRVRAVSALARRNAPADPRRGRGTSTDAPEAVPGQERSPAMASRVASMAVSRDSTVTWQGQAHTGTVVVCGGCATDAD